MSHAARWTCTALAALGLGACAQYEYRQLALASPLLRVQLRDRAELDPERIARVAKRAAAEDWQLDSFAIVAGGQQVLDNRTDPTTLRGKCDEYGNVWLRLRPDAWEDLVRAEPTIRCQLRAGARVWTTECRLLVPADRRHQGVIGSMLIPKWVLVEGE